MCERPGFWRWLVHVSAMALRGLPRFMGEVVRAVPGVVKETLRMPMITASLRDPFYEFFTGIMALGIFPIWSIFGNALTLDMRIVMALLSIPSFLLMMHGLYRSGDDC